MKTKTGKKTGLEGYGEAELWRELWRRIDGDERKRERLIAARALEAACKAWKIPAGDVAGGTRVEPAAAARWTVWWLLKEHGWSLARIGRTWSGGMGNGTVLTGIRKLNGRMDTEFAARVAVKKAARAFAEKTTNCHE